AGALQQVGGIDGAEKARLAPSPDGSVVYIVEDSGPAIGRLVRQQDGTYVHDTAWHLDNFDAGGTSWTPHGMYIATDAWGDLFVSNGSYAVGDPNVILEYGADGHLKARFGDYGTGDGQFLGNYGIAVTRDGRSVYVADANNRIERFDYGLDGNYHYALKWG